jgi:hypothetical protein
MSLFGDSTIHGISDGEDLGDSTAGLESQLIAHEDRLRELPADASDLDRANIELFIARLYVGLDRKQEAWNLARRIFDIFLDSGEWEKAVDACDILFLSEEEGSLAALGQGVWLAVTYPIDPELTVGMLQHIIDETPDDADGAAVAAATAIYVTELRAEGKKKENLLFFANQMLGNVARRHSNIEDQEQFNFWIEKMELNEPEKFLIRLRNVIDVLVQEDWWFDRDDLRSKIPVN